MEQRAEGARKLKKARGKKSRRNEKERLKRKIEEGIAAKRGVNKRV